MDDRFKVFATVDFPKLERTKGNWYPAVSAFHGSLSRRLFWAHDGFQSSAEHQVGVVKVSVAGCKIELFEPASYQSYASNAAPRMKNIIKTYDGNPY